jgi:hypothetical protein
MTDKTENHQKVVIAYAVALGLEVWHTGGGCTALAKKLDYDWHILLTDGDGMIPEKLDEPDCLACIYTTDGESWTTIKLGNAIECINTVAGLASYQH